MARYKITLENTWFEVGENYLKDSNSPGAIAYRLRQALKDRLEKIEPGSIRNLNAQLSSIQGKDLDCSPWAKPDGLFVHVSGQKHQVGTLEERSKPLESD